MQCTCTLLASKRKLLTSYIIMVECNSELPILYYVALYINTRSSSVCIISFRSLNLLYHINCKYIWNFLYTIRFIATRLTRSAMVANDRYIHQRQSGHTVNEISSLAALAGTTTHLPASIWAYYEQDLSPSWHHHTSTSVNLGIL